MPKNDITHNWLTCLEEMEKSGHTIKIFYTGFIGKFWRCSFTHWEHEASTLPEAVIGAWEKVKANFKNSDKND